MASNKTKVFHLELEGEHYYFGSPKAMFDTLGEDRLHMKYTSFHSNISLKVGDVYTNRRNGWVLRVGVIQQAKTNRGNRWEQIIQDGIANALAARGLENEPAAAEPVEQPVVEQPVEQPVVEQPVVEQPIEQPVEQPAETTLFEVADQPAEAPAEPAAKPASRSKKKKGADVPEQLTLF